MFSILNIVVSQQVLFDLPVFQDFVLTRHDSPLIQGYDYEQSQSLNQLSRSVSLFVVVVDTVVGEGQCR